VCIYYDMDRQQADLPQQLLLNRLLTVQHAALLGGA
jgi:hypothetical protein